MLNQPLSGGLNKLANMLKIKLELLYIRITFILLTRSISQSGRSSFAPIYFSLDSMFYAVH